MLNTKDRSGDFLAFTFLLMLIAVCVIGYVANLVALYYALPAPLTGMTTVRFFGVFFIPLGVVIGFF